MSAFRIEPMDRVAPPPKRRPRINDARHLAFVAQLPCVITGTRPVDVAHLRTGNLLLGKRHVGASEKPDDRWTAPLCRALHTEQHSMNEIKFWARHGIGNPWQLCLALFAASVADDLELAERIVAAHMRIGFR